ncbi:hypothetical protein U7230_07935 [Carboxydochorda subterranea]|uniref:O-antigen ligase-like membrane protein n=1 Tax=Carboxydichorda subterranea TaxID=3109565 RepID=A0ABZ1BTD4_9FIRM|nr:hypothetical protein [Limnochorda sp. L945t]WRP16039.1 hypothetical protein U7230_07935 [Limnochorda sp. L945t]
MVVTPAGLFFLLAGVVLFWRGSRAIFAGLLFGAAFPSTAVVIVQRFDYGVQPYQWFAALYLLRAVGEWLWGRVRARPQGTGKHPGLATDGDRRRLAWLVAAWVATVTLGWELGAGPARALSEGGAGGVPRGVELLDPGKRLFHLLYLYAMVLVAAVAYRETRACAGLWPRGFGVSSDGARRAGVLVRAVAGPWLWGAVAAAAWGGIQLVSHYLGWGYPRLFNDNPTFAMVAGAMAGPLKQVNSTFPEPSMYAMFMVPTALLSAAWANPWLTAALVVSAMASFSTTGMLGLGVGGVLALAGSALVPPSRPRRAILWTGTAMVGAALLLAAPGLTAAVTPQAAGGERQALAPRQGPAYRQHRSVGREIVDALARKGVQKGSTDSGEERKSALFGGLKLWLQRPLLGWGAGTLRTKDLASNTLANLGIAGFAILYGSMAWAAWRGLTRGAPILALTLLTVVLLQSAAVPDFVFPYMWLLTGMLWGLPEEAWVRA